MDKLSIVLMSCRLTVNALEEERAIESQRWIDYKRLTWYPDTTNVHPWILRLDCESAMIDMEDASFVMQKSHIQKPSKQLFNDDGLNTRRVDRMGSTTTERYSDSQNFLEQIAADFELEAQNYMAIEVSSETVTWCWELDAEKWYVDCLLSNAIKYGHENSKPS